MTTHPYDIQPPAATVAPSKPAVTAPTPAVPPTPGPALAPQIMGNPTTTQKAPAYEEMLLNDTKKFVETVRNEAVQVVLDKERIKENNRTFREEFYAENSDLKDYNAEVELVLKGRLQDWATLDVSEAKKRLATETRSMIDKIKQKSGVKIEEVTSIKATTLPSSGEQVKGTGTPTQTKPTSFVEEWQSHKNRNRQKG